jgi:excisionase family DNA binding protein
MDAYFSARAVARELDSDRRKILDAIARGDIKAERVGQRYRVSREEMLRLRKDKDAQMVRAGGARYSRQQAEEALRRLRAEDSAALEAARRRYMESGGDLIIAKALHEAVGRTLDYSQAERLVAMLSVMEHEAEELADAE